MSPLIDEKYVYEFLLSVFGLGKSLNDPVSEEEVAEFFFNLLKEMLRAEKEEDKHNKREVRSKANKNTRISTHKSRRSRSKNICT